MPCIIREVAEHALKIRLGFKPVKQHLCRFDEGKRRAIGEEITKLLAAGFIKELEDKFDGLELNHISRHLNEAADALAKAASSREPMPIGIFASDHHKPSVRYEEPEQASDGPPALGSGANQPLAPSDPEVMELDEDPVTEPDPLTDWRMPYLNYLLREALLTDKTEARQLACRAKSFAIVDGELYRRNHIKILQRCIPIEQGKQLLSDIHGGVCGHHAASRTLVKNAFQQGFYWPTMVADAEHIVRTCEGCQYYARQTHLPT
ncbi:uncharacterized protein [Miscanthus floridulus]|uniref:uncharacterized protein n=1 Tax=Miscanthus floridulus TaxID=154761 RepID=UPI00345A1DF1